MVRNLEQLVLDERVPPEGEPATELTTDVPAPTSRDPFGFVCAFGFSGSFDTPAAVPTTKEAFVDAIGAEIAGIGMIQRGLQSYQVAINSRQHHTFSTQFLIDQNTATVITIDQLDQIVAHLETVREEVSMTVEHDEAEVKKDLVEAFEQAQPWVSRTRAILLHSHVFYKINFALASDKKA